MSVTIDERTGDSDYEDALAAIEFHRTQFGSASNSAVQIIRASPLYLLAKTAMGDRFPEGNTARKEEG